ncbi:MAG TPA: RDD family protein [Pyrinomonadaceae bacterium]|nr:RDD family protein [Pyrinomonadaceae bacterium]
MSLRTETAVSPAGEAIREGRAATRVAGVGVSPARLERLRAPFSLRCGALLVDYTILAAILAFSTLLARAFGGDARWAGASVLTLGYLLALVAGILNFVVLASWTGRTLGKWVTNLRIERRDGTELSFARASLRHLVGYTLTLATLGLGFLLAAFNREGRALHDLIAGTIVVRGGRGVPRGVR